MKRFLIFHVYQNERYCSGGWDDFLQDADTLEEAESIARTNDDYEYQVVSFNRDP